MISLWWATLIFFEKFTCVIDWDFMKKFTMYHSTCGQFMWITIRGCRKIIWGVWRRFMFYRWSRFLWFCYMILVWNLQDCFIASRCSLFAPTTLPAPCLSHVAVPGKYGNGLPLNTLISICFLTLLDCNFTYVCLVTPRHISKLLASRFELQSLKFLIFKGSFCRLLLDKATARNL
jgi:hypothetical protein